MKILKALIIIFFTYAITASFFIQISRESYSSFLKEYNDYFYDEEYYGIVFDVAYNTDMIDFEKLSEKYTFSVEQLISNSDHLEIKIFFDNKQSMDNLFGANQACKIPFSSLENDCGYISNDNSLVVSADSIDNFNSSNYSSRTIIYVKENQSAEFIQTIVNEYNVDVDKIYQWQLEPSGSGNLNMSDTKMSIENILIILAITSCILTVIKIGSNLTSYRIQNINGSSFIKVYIDNALKDNLQFVFFLVFCIGIVLIYLQVNYSMWLAKYYILTNWAMISTFIAVILFFSLLAFALCYIGTTYKFLNHSTTYKKLNVFSVALTVLVFAMFNKSLPYAEFKDYLVRYSEFENYTRKLIDLNYMTYITENYSSFDSNLEYSDSQLAEFQEIIKNNQFDIKHMERYTHTLTYMSKDIAQLHTKYKYESNQNYLVGPNCSDFTPLSETLSIDKYIIEDVSLTGGLEGGDICLVVIDNFDEEIIEYLTAYIDYTMVYAHDLETTFLVRSGLTSTYDPMTYKEMQYKIAEGVFWMITLMFSNMMMFVTYINSYRKYEYYQYINNRKYPLLFRYIAIKIVINLCLLSLASINQSLLYFLPLLGLDLISYLIYRFYYQNHLNKLKGE